VIAAGDEFVTAEKSHSPLYAAKTDSQDPARDRRRRQADVALLLLIGEATALNIAAPVGGARTIVTFLAAVLVPGAAIVTWLDTRDGVQAVALAIGLSLGVDIAVSLAMAWLGLWHPSLAAAGLAAISAIVLATDFARRTFGSASPSARKS